MKSVFGTLVVFFGVCGTSAVWAQYGLYGSPEPLPMTQPAAYPSTAMPAAQPAPSATYAQPQPQTQYNNGYLAQPPAMAMYQPYPSGTRYRYPAPSAPSTPATRPAYRTAAVQPPAPIPAPEGMPVEPTPQNSGMVDQVLSDQGNCQGAYGSPCNQQGVYSGPCNQYEQAACGPYADGCGIAGCDYFCPWYASVSALALGRSDGRRMWTSFVDGSPEIQLSNTDFNLAWKWGGEVRFGRRFCCACTPYALEGSFWTTEAFFGSQYTSLYDPTDPTPVYVSTPVNIDNINFIFPTGTLTARDFFNGARSHTVQRRDEFYNFEVNLIREQLAWASDSPWDIGWSIGVRYFRFQEGLTFSTISQNADGDAFFKDSITNNLVGVQFGFDAAYNVMQNVRLFITPKVGVYDNFMNNDFQARARYNGGAYVDGTVDVTGYPSFPVHSTANGIAFLTQIDVGADWQFTRNWSVRAGYRVVATTGMALADDQFPQYTCDTPDMANPQHYSSLILHGAFLGVTYNF